ncbi:hypothetical protein LOC68_24275 [Blastopirellula sp. JC732]|uniref:Thioredoxin domain-containing protein n=1 Tax=Blastopirellula sediminis TaxID=2894196 RepID=A0A9X1SHQ7_9BACT|nr:hypothetical protein [Blastopirellula sediminis]MCC9605175.1 hypothetical protein [Blastopirellula sediminis]MCC9631525.1 hypothetical protein [Blastopirellula sediminis]
MKKLVFGLALALCLGLSAHNLMAAEADEVKSGPEVGSQPAPFVVEDVTGPAKGETLCYRCRYSGRPTIAIFARDMDANVQDLVKQIDSTVAKNSDQKLSAFVVMLSDSPADCKGELEKVAAANKIEETPLTVFKDSKGPKPYKVSKDAKVSVMMWNAEGVKVNHAFSANPTKEQISTIVADTKKILE